MFQHGFDVLAESAPEWYAEVDKALEKENFQDATRLAREAVKTCSEAKDKKGETIATLAYLKILIAEEDVWNAKKVVEDALKLAGEAKDQELKAAATHLRAKILLKDRKADDASKAAQEAMQMYKELGNQKGELSVKITNSRILISQKRLLDAQKAAEEVRDKAVDLGKHKALSNAANYMLYEIAMKDESIYVAIQALEAVIDACTDANDAYGAGSALYLVAEVQRMEGQLQEAADRAAHAAQKFDEVMDASKKGKAVLTMAKVFHIAEQFRDAREASEAALELFKMARNKAGQAESLRIMADCNLKESQDLQKAMYQLEEVSFLYRQIKSKKNEANALNELTKLQVNSGNPELDLNEVLRRARRACMLFAEDWAEDTLGNAEANMTVANICVQLDDELDEAMANAATALKVFEKLDNQQGSIDAALVLSKLFFKFGNRDEGAKMANKALDLSGEDNKIGQAAASDLIENEGKEKKLPDKELSDIYILLGGVRIAYFDEFEARRARYKAMDGGGKQAAVTSGFDPQKVQKNKSQYTILWTRVPNVNLQAGAARA